MQKKAVGQPRSTARTASTIGIGATAPWPVHFSAAAIAASGTSSGVIIAAAECARSCGK